MTKDHNERWTVDQVLTFFSEEIYPRVQDDELLQPEIESYTGIDLWASQQILADFRSANEVAEERMQQMANSIFLRPATVNDMDAFLELQGHGHKDRLLENPESISSILAQGLSWVACMTPPPGPTPPLYRHSAPIGYILVRLVARANFNAHVLALPGGYATAISTEPWFVRDVVVHRDRRKKGMLSSVCTSTNAI